MFSWKAFLRNYSIVFFLFVSVRSFCCLFPIQRRVHAPTSAVAYEEEEEEEKEGEEEGEGGGEEEEGEEGEKEKKRMRMRRMINEKKER